MTDGDFDAEQHRQWRKRSWWNCSTDLIVITLAVLITAAVKRRKKR